MGTVGTAVGCAVGIPIGVGLLVAFTFWWRLQRRFKRELEDDKDLEREIYDESAFISFNNLDSMRQTPDNNDIFTSRDELNPDQDDSNRRKSNVYIPAYRRKINHLQQQHVYETTGNNNSNVGDGIDNHIMHPPRVLSRSSFNSSSPNIHESQQIRQLSVYDQMVPFVDPQSAFADSKNNIIDHTSMRSEFTLPNNNTDTPSALTTPHKTDSLMIRHIQNQDLGSFYPSMPMSTNASFQNLRGTTTATSISSLNNSANIFNTPTSKNEKNPYLNHRHHNDSDNDNNIPNNQAEDTTTPTDIESDYILKNNYDVNDNGVAIAEEDQYENEFTNYKENRRQFLDSLRPE